MTIKQELKTPIAKFHTNEQYSEQYLLPMEGELRKALDEHQEHFYGAQRDGQTRLYEGDRLRNRTR